MHHGDFDINLTPMSIAFGKFSHMSATQTVEYWKRYCMIYMKLHALSSSLYETLFLSLFVIMFGASGVSTVLSLVNVNCDYTLNTTAGIMSIISGLSVVLTKQFSLAEKVQKHSLNTKRYAHLMTELDMIHIQQFDTENSEELSRRIVLKVRRDVAAIWVDEQRPPPVATWIFEWRNKAPIHSLMYTPIPPQVQCAGEATLITTPIPIPSPNPDPEP
jgi:hypothetical protein